MNLGLIGCSKIAETVLKTLQNLSEITLYACASRDINKANKFKEQYKFIKAYSNYGDLLNDKNVDFVYITLINTLHYEFIKKAIEKGKHVICEKPFTMNYKEAKEVISLAKAKRVTVVDATWTRYMPYIDMLSSLLLEKVIGNVTLVTATLSYNLLNVDRLTNKDLGGGSLLDLGVYPLNFVFSILGSDYKSIKSNAIIHNEVDYSQVTTLTYENNVTAIIYSSIFGEALNNGYIYGDEGHIEVINVNNPSAINIFDKNNTLQSSIKLTHSYSGYEYEFIELVELIKNRQIESKKFPFKEILKVEETLDKIRVSYSNN